MTKECYVKGSADYGCVTVQGVSSHVIQPLLTVTKYLMQAIIISLSPNIVTSVKTATAV